MAAGFSCNYLGNNLMVLGCNMGSVAKKTKRIFSPSCFLVNFFYELLTYFLSLFSNKPAGMCSLCVFYNERY